VTGGASSVILIVGEAGIGKTALLLEARRLAEQSGVRVLRASGVTLERDFGYGVVRQLLEPAVRVLTNASREQVFSGPAAPAADVFGLALRERGVAHTMDRAFLVRHALVSLVWGLAERGPLLLWVDDLQWVDGASLRWLAHLSRRVEGVPLFLLMALRSGEESASDEALAELRAAAGDGVLEPAALSARAVSELAISELGGADDDFALRCHEATAGNPLLVRELLRAAREDALSPTRESAARLETLAAQRLGDRVVRRLARLSAEARELAGAVAVLGAGDLRHAAALAGLDDRQAEGAADELHGAGILTGERPLRFVHPLLGTAVEADLSPARRASAHRRAAVLLDADPARADEAMVHLLRADPAGDPWAVERLCAAAARALDRGAPDAAVALLERALTEPAGDMRGEVVAGLGRAHRRLGHSTQAVEYFAEAQAYSARSEREALARERAWTLAERDRSQEGAAVLEAAIEDLEGPEEEVREARLRLEADFSTVAFAGDSLARRGIERIERAALGLTGASAAERAVLAGAAYARYWTASVDADTFAAAIEPLLSREQALDELTPGSLTRIQLVLAVFHADRVELALRMLEERIAHERRRGDVPLLVGYLNARARVLAFLGALEEAEATAREGLAYDTVFVHSWGQPSLLAALLVPLVWAGRIEEAQAALDERGPAGPIGPVGTFHVARMELRSAQGRHDEAVADAEALLSRLQARGHAGIRLRDVAAGTFLAAGEDTRAAQVAREGLDIARRWGAPSTIAPNLRVLGLATAEEAPLREAVALLEGGPFRFELARCLLALGSHLRRTRRRSQARDPLRRALDLAHRCGAHPLLETARAELRACGARPRSPASSGLESLTASERRVAELVAGGQSNPQVARTLFISRSTVEAHLRSIFRKLEISSRHELAPLLAETETPPAQTVPPPGRLPARTEPAPGQAERLPARAEPRPAPTKDH
jgi:DNA-binding CsgD family transcriptional regulator/tetratricopeptide (TPR) repeat protein